MKVLIVVSLLVAVALARPADDVQITKSDFENIGIDGYKFS